MEEKVRNFWPVFRTNGEYLAWIDELGDNVDTEEVRWLAPAVVKIGDTYYGLPNGFYSYMRIKYQFIPNLEFLEKYYNEKEEN